MSVFSWLAKISSLQINHLQYKTYATFLMRQGWLRKLNAGRLQKLNELALSQHSRVSHDPDEYRAWYEQASHRPHAWAKSRYDDSKTAA